MISEWWPRSLAHIPKEDPWAQSHVIVAEIKNLDDGGDHGMRVTVSTLVPPRALKALRRNLAALDNEVRTSGPWPYPQQNKAFRPRFWVEGYGLLGARYEPLVLSWRSHDRTVLVLDPGFLMTYGLVPRAGADGVTDWDDLTGPVRSVARVSPTSLYPFPSATNAFVSIARDYLQDYLTLRKRALVQSFCERRFSPSDSEIDQRLGREQCVDIDAPDRRLRLFRMPGRGSVLAEVSGARVVALPGARPISDNPLETEGLTWPGVEGPVTHARAMSMRPHDWVYVDDRVLEDYEGRTEDFRVFPESGGVLFGSQWAVGYCARVGRNTIRLELKKLYEGIPPAVTRHWNKFAVDPPPFPANLNEPNIAKRAKMLVFEMVSLGENLSNLAHAVGLTSLGPGEFTSLRREDLKQKGWWSLSLTEPIARHAPLNMPLDAFLDRCLSLNKILTEGLVQASLRRTVLAIGAPSSAVEDFASLKLLDCVVRLGQVAHATGLKLGRAAGEIWDRLAKDGTDPQQPIPHLFALHDLRLLKAHKSEDQGKLVTCLARFGVQVTEAAAGYGLILDKVYDTMIEELKAVNSKFEAALLGG